jgi:translation initiation factor 1
MKKRPSEGGLVYSTAAHVKLDTAHDEPEAETLPAEKQKLKVSLDRRNRAGKEVTLVTGFVGSTADLESLGKLLKNKCGTGGSVKDNQIIIQGNVADKVKGILNSLGYRI